MKKMMTKAIAFFLVNFFTVQAWAQEKGVDVNIDINKKDADWYKQPWVWVVGGAVFILLLVAMLKGGGKKD